MLLENEKIEGIKARTRLHYRMSKNVFNRIELSTNSIIQNTLHIPTPKRNYERVET